MLRPGQLRSAWIALSVGGFLAAGASTGYSAVRAGVAATDNRQPTARNTNNEVNEVLRGNGGKLLGEAVGEMEDNRRKMDATLLQSARELDAQSGAVCTEQQKQQDIASLRQAMGGVGVLNGQGASPSAVQQYQAAMQRLINRIHVDPANCGGKVSGRTSDPRAEYMRDQARHMEEQARMTEALNRFSEADRARAEREIQQAKQHYAGERERVREKFDALHDDLDRKLAELDGEKTERPSRPAPNPSGLELAELKRDLMKDIGAPGDGANDELANDLGETVRPGRPQLDDLVAWDPDQDIKDLPDSYPATIDGRPVDVTRPGSEGDLLADGRPTQINYKGDGVVEETYADGRKVEYTNGEITDEQPPIPNMPPPGQQPTGIEYAQDGTVVETYPDGRRVEYDADGKVDNISVPPANMPPPSDIPTQMTFNKDGTMVNTYADGRKVEYQADGSLGSVTMPDGSRSTPTNYQADGTPQSGQAPGAGGGTGAPTYGSQQQGGNDPLVAPTAPQPGSTASPSNPVGAGAQTSGDLVQNSQGGGDSQGGRAGGSWTPPGISLRGTAGGGTVSHFEGSDDRSSNSFQVPINGGGAVVIKKSVGTDGTSTYFAGVSEGAGGVSLQGGLSYKSSNDERVIGTVYVELSGYARVGGAFGAQTGYTYREPLATIRTPAAYLNAKRQFSDIRNSWNSLKNVGLNFGGDSDE